MASSASAETYAFPIGAQDPWGDVAYPVLSDLTWVYKGTLPKGVDVTDVKPIAGNRVKATVAGEKGVNTADWAYS